MDTRKVETWLLVAAESREFDGLRRLAAGWKKLDSRIAMLAASEVEGRRWILAANGAGPALAAEAARSGLGNGTVDRVISMGTCGALADTLAVGDIVAAAEVIGADGCLRFPAVLPRCGAPFHSGPILSADRVAATRRDKQKARESGAIAVEMEAAGVAEVTRAAGVPFSCIRAVSDTSDEDMPLDFNVLRDAAGRFDLARIAAAAAARPAALPGLLRLGRNARVASKNLGEFLVHCRFD